MNNTNFFDRVVEKAVEVLKQSDFKAPVSFVFMFDVRPYGVLNVDIYTTSGAATDFMKAVNKRMNNVVSTLSVDQINLKTERPHPADITVIDDRGNTNEELYKRALLIYFEF